MGNRLIFLYHLERVINLGFDAVEQAILLLK
jgi:hypothetical protein